MSEDPIGFSSGDANFYRYVGNDPINFIDSSGLHKKDKWYGYNNKDFQKWFHRCWKQAGNQDADKSEIADVYQEWLRHGSPKGGKCGSPSKEECSITDSEAIALGVGAGLGGYLLYRGLRIVPSLFPPLWWTLPTNLATP